MAFTTGTMAPIRNAAASLRPRAKLVFGAAILFGAAGIMVPDMGMRLTFWLTGLVLLMSAIWILVLEHAALALRRGAVEAAQELLSTDAAPSILTDADGHICFSNVAADNAFGADQASTLAGALKQALANPGPVLFRLESRAASRGSAHEDVVTRQGHLGISVHRTGGGRFLWRIEKSADRPAREADPIPLPMLTAGRNDAVLFMNTAARNLVGERARKLDRIFPKLPLRSGQLNDVSTADGVTSCLVVELEGVAGRREVFLLPGVAPTERQPDGWAFFDELPVPLLKVARNGEIQLSNRPARDLLGVEHCADKGLADLMEGLGRSITDWLDDAAAGRGTVHSEFLRVKREDREAYVQVTLNRAAENRETVLIAVLSDATKLKSLEAQSEGC